MFTPKPKLDLQVPHSWNACTPAQLRIIASTLMDAEQRATSFMPVNDTDVKIRLFLALTGLLVLSTTEKGFLVVGNKETIAQHPVAAEPFEIENWQIQSWISPVKQGEKIVRPGVLDWLWASSKDYLLVYPFPVYRARLPILGGLLTIPTTMVFNGPEPLMQDFSWQRYRFASDYMQLYVDQSNAMVKAEKKMHHPLKKEDAIKLIGMKKDIYKTRSLFLSTIHTARGRTFNADLVDRNARYFDTYSDVDFQCVLFWWQGMMHYLHSQYPRCFKAANKPARGRKAQRIPNPLEFYVSTVATLEKYIGLNEEQVNNEIFHLPLQHLERIARENEEIERMQKK